MEAPEPPYTITFDPLKEGDLGLSAAYRSFIVEAAHYCLYKNEHHSPTSLLVLMLDVPATANLFWQEVGPELDSTWADLKEAAEYGAYAVAIAVCTHTMTFPSLTRK